MSLIVQKFGGTSLSDDHSRSHVLRHIVREQQAGNGIVVVVSAMGRRGEPYATDSLLELVSSRGKYDLHAREKDLLISCGEVISAAVLCGLLNAQGIASVVLTGGQAGIITNARFGAARIERIVPDAIIQHVAEGRVVIVTGFQGMTEQGDITTLGRGGSDTSATALGAALEASVVDIYTDVDGILTADPRWVSDARPLSVVSYEEICNMAHNGAKVIHPRAVEIAMRASIPVRVRSTFSEGEGTLVTRSEKIRSNGQWSDRTVTGLAHVRGISQIAVGNPQVSADLQSRIFRAMASHGISVDFINVIPTGVHYTVSQPDTELAVQLLRDLGYKPIIRMDCAKVSIIGGGMNEEPGVMAGIVETLTNLGIPILQSADSNTTIWVLIPESELAVAMQALHRTFELHLTYD
ncbi:MAG: aspartate kinase [Candidatus Cohnella colombiensis]|uniref:Aspartokinase n=1 Tax=Candidatus Cohnella colombiensis TaxID=3121368 RepID=A0AA95F095_9BACL|nr:MAG: aspartate kinase [Cohnella sp.]